MRSRTSALWTASAMALGLSPCLALAGGIIRDADITTSGHALASIGTIAANYSGTSSAADYIGLNNPFKSVGSAPNSLAASSTNADWSFFPDVAANTTATSQLPGSGFTNWLRDYRFYITANTQGNTAAARNTLGNVGATFTAETASTYSGNTAGPFVWTGYQNSQGLASSFKLNMTQTVSVFDNPLVAGSALQLTTITITRSAANATADALPLLVNLGLLADVNANGQTSGSTETNASGAGEIRVRSAVSGGFFADVYGIGATSFQVGDVSATTSNAAAHLLNTTNLAGSGAALGNSLSPTGIGADHAVGLLWNGLTLTNVGDSVTITTGVQFVPTPGAAGLLGLAGIAVLRRRRA